MAKPGVEMYETHRVHIDNTYVCDMTLIETPYTAITIIEVVTRKGEVIYSKRDKSFKWERLLGSQLGEELYRRNVTKALDEANSVLNSKGVNYKLGLWL